MAAAVVGRSRALGFFFFFSAVYQSKESKRIKTQGNVLQKEGGLAGTQRARDPLSLE